MHNLLTCSDWQTIVAFCHILHSIDVMILKTCPSTSILMHWEMSLLLYLRLQVPYDLLVGADGSNSVVRSALQRMMGASYVRRYKHKQVYSMRQASCVISKEVPLHSQFYAHAAKVCCATCYLLYMSHQLFTYVLYDCAFVKCTQMPHMLSAYTVSWFQVA